jgi:hypothetical protein
MEAVRAVMENIEDRLRDDHWDIEHRLLGWQDAANARRAA